MSDEQVAVERYPAKVLMPNGDTLCRGSSDRYWTVTDSKGRVSTNETDDELADSYGLDALFLAGLAALSTRPEPQGDGVALADVLGRLHDNLSSAPADATKCFVSLDDHRTILAALRRL